MNSNEKANRLVELTREIAGAQGLAGMLREAWKDATPENRKKLIDEMVVSLQGDRYVLREVMLKIVNEAIESDPAIRERVMEVVKANLPEVEKQVISEVTKQIAEAVKNAVPDALQRILSGRRW